MWIISLVALAIVCYFIFREPRSTKNKNIAVRSFTPPEPRDALISKSNKKEICVQSTIAGIPFCLGKKADITKIFSINDKLSASRDKLNAHDSNAIKLFKGDLFVGFIAKLNNQKIALHLDGGGKVIVKIIDINSLDLWGGVKISIELI